LLNNGNRAFFVGKIGNSVKMCVALVFAEMIQALFKLTAVLCQSNKKRGANKNASSIHYY
jgi:hypothetical protein